MSFPRVSGPTDAPDAMSFSLLETTLLAVCGALFIALWYTMKDGDKDVPFLKYGRQPSPSAVEAARVAVEHPLSPPVLSPRSRSGSYSYNPPAGLDDSSEGEVRRVPWRTSSQALDVMETRALQDPSLSAGTMTMDEAAALQSKSHDARRARSPADYLKDLRQGNARFFLGKHKQTSKLAASLSERRAVVLQQAPMVAVVGCADSRVPPEIVFDAELGDLFTIRQIGNMIYKTGAAMASIDYAVANLGVKVVLVLGHEGCGAVKLAMIPQSEIDKQTPAVKPCLTEIKQHLAGQTHLNKIKDPRARDREAVVANVMAQCKRCHDNPVVAKAVKDGKCMVVGAFYEISSGVVDFFCETGEG